MPEKLTCPRCGGEGLIEVYNEADSPYPEHVICPNCRGRGVVPVEEDIIPQSYTFPAHDPDESGTLEAGLDAALELHNREETLLARAVKAEAGCAEMRDWLQEIEATCSAMCKDCGDTDDCGDCNYGHIDACTSAALSSSAGKALLERVKHLEQAEGLLREVVKAPQQAQEMMQREGFVIDNLEDRWQKLAFTLYTQLAQLSVNAKGILEEDDEPKEGEKPNG